MGCWVLVFGLCICSCMWSGCGGGGWGADGAGEGGEVFTYVYFMHANQLHGRVYPPLSARPFSVLQCYVVCGAGVCDILSSLSPVRLKPYSPACICIITSPFRIVRIRTKGHAAHNRIHVVWTRPQSSINQAAASVYEWVTDVMCLKTNDIYERIVWHIDFRMISGFVGFCYLSVFANVVIGPCVPVLVPPSSSAFSFFVCVCLFCGRCLSFASRYFVKGEARLALRWSGRGRMIERICFLFTFQRLDFRIQRNVINFILFVWWCF